MHLARRARTGAPGASLLVGPRAPPIRRRVVFEPAGGSMLMDSPKIVPAQEDGPTLLRVAEGVESTGAALADLQPGGVGPGYWLSDDDVRLRIENLPASYPVVLLSAT